MIGDSDRLKSVYYYVVPEFRKCYFCGEIKPAKYIYKFEDSWWHAKTHQTTYYDRERWLCSETCLENFKESEAERIERIRVDNENFMKDREKKEKESLARSARRSRALIITGPVVFVALIIWWLF